MCHKEVGFYTSKYVREQIKVYHCKINCYFICQLAIAERFGWILSGDAIAENASFYKWMCSQEGFRDIWVD